MANELKTTLDLDIKPFLDALKRVATQVQSLEEIRPKFNTQEFQKIQAEISRFKPEINVAVNVDKKSLDAVQQEISATGDDPINIQVLINSEEIQRSINRVQELRSTALTIPPITNLNVDTNTENAINELDQFEIKSQEIGNVFDETFILKVNTQDAINNIAKINEAISGLQDLQTRTNIPSLMEGGLDYSEALEQSENVQDSIRKVIDALLEIRQFGDTKIELNDEDIRTAFQLLEEEVNQFGRTLQGLDLSFDVEGIKRADIAIGDFQNELAKTSKSYYDFQRAALDRIFPNIDKDIEKIKETAAITDTLESAIEKVKNLSERFNITPEVNEEELQKAIAFAKEIDERYSKISREKYDTLIPIKLEGEDKVVKQLQDIRSNLSKILQSGFDETIKLDFVADIADADKITDELNKIPNSKTTKVDIIGEENVKKEANNIEKELRDIPNQKNVKVNVDTKGAGSALSGVSGFGKQLTSGLLASFSGAAIGAAIANFATQAVRGIGQAIKTADELQDSLILAFTQVGAPDIELSLEGANRFALELSNNFGIATERSKTLLAQVVGLTGEFGATSEAVTKAAIGIEAATGGLVKAEQAARLFSRSIGNPEDQAALETLAKRFPAIGDAIRSTTEPAERANAVIENLSGTFTALNKDSQDLFSTLQRLGDTFTAVFGVAFAPIADALAPIIQSITNDFLANTETITSFGQSIVDNFLTPLRLEFENIGPSLDKLVKGFAPLLQVVSGISFDILITALQILGPLLGIVGDVLLVLSPALEKLGDIVSAILAPVFKLFNNELYNSLDPTGQLISNVLELTPVMESLANIVSLLNPILNLLGNLIVDIVIPALQGLEGALAIVLIPFRLLNFAFDVGKKFVADYGDSIATLASQIQKFLVLVPPLFVATKVLGVLADYANKPLDIKFGVNLGDLSKIGDIPADVFGEQFDAAENLNRQYGVNLPKAIGKYSGAVKSGGSEASKTNEKTLSELDKQLKKYEELNKSTARSFELQQKLNQLVESESRLDLNKELTTTKEIQKINQEIVDSKNQQLQLEQNIAKAFGITGKNADEVSKKVQQIGKDFIESGGDISKLPITLPKKLDENTVKSAERIGEEFAKLVFSGLEATTKQQDLQFEINKLQFKVDREAIASQVEVIGQQIQNTLQQYQFSNDAFAELDTTSLGIAIRTLKDLKLAADTSLEPYRKKLNETAFAVQSQIRVLTALEKAGKTNSAEYEEQRKKLILLQDEYNQVNNATKEFRESSEQAGKQLREYGNDIENSVLARLQRLTDIQQINLTFDLNAEGLSQAEIDIQKNFAQSVSEINALFEIERQKIEKGVSQTTQTVEDLAEAQKNALANVAVDTELALRQFRLQNNVVVAITESLRRNLSSVFAPDTAEAQKTLDDRKKGLDSELELLKTNLELGLVSYQEYNAKILELEKEKTDAIKEYDDSVKETRLNNLKQIAEDALPALNNQLLRSEAELTVLLRSGTATFTEVAEQGLETIGFIAAQSLAVAVQQAQDLEQIERLFVKTAINNILRVLQAELVAATLKAIFSETARLGPAGLITGALLGGALAVLFAQAEAKLLALLGYEQGGYTGDGGRKEVAGVVHGQEFVVNADATKKNRPVLEWLNKTNGTFEQYIAKTSKETLSNEKFAVLNEQVMRNFDNRLSNIELQVADKNALNVNNYVDTKSMANSINGLAYTMDNRLASLETTVDKAIRQNATLTKSANQLDVSVYSDPGTTLKYAKKIGKIKGLS